MKTALEHWGGGSRVTDDDPCAWPGPRVLALLLYGMANMAILLLLLGCVRQGQET